MPLHVYKPSRNAYRPPRLAIALGLATLAASIAHLSAPDRDADAQTPPIASDRTAVVSFTSSRTIALIDALTGESILEAQAQRAVRALTLTPSGDWLVVASPSAIESIHVSGTTDRRQLALPGANLVTTGSGGAWLYCTRTRPVGVSALPLPSLAPVGWTARAPSPPRALAVDEASSRLVIAHGGGSGLIEVVDAAAGTTQRTIPIGQLPMALTLTHDARTAFVTLRDGTLASIGLGDGTVSVLSKIARRPRALAISPDDRRLYVLDPPRRAVMVADRSMAAMPQAIALPANPYDMALSPDGRRLLVTSPRVRSIFVIDTATLAITQTLHFSRAPRHIAFAPRRMLGTPSPPPTTGNPRPSATETSVVVRPPDPTPTPRSTAGPTVTTTATYAPPAPQPRAAVGMVFDDSSAQPLPSVRVNTRGSGTPTYPDSAGRYVITELPALVDLTKDGYTRAVRRLATPGSAVTAHVPDARLARLASAHSVGSEGGSVATDYTIANTSSGTVELTVSPGTLTTPTDIQLTVLNPQALIAPLPLGWSALLGIDIRVEQPTAASATLHVPVPLLSAAMSVPLYVAVWDDEMAQWRAGAPVTETATAIEITVTGLPTQLALIAGDVIPTPPPTPLAGTALHGVAALQRPGESAVVMVAPDTVVAGTDLHTQVHTRVHAVAPLPSGSRLMVELREFYELRDGRALATGASRQDLIGYQLSASAPQGGNAGDTLGADFTLRPSRTFATGELTQGRITIDALLPQDDDPAGVVATAGGDLVGLGGVRLRVPPDATSQTMVVALRPAAAVDLPDGVSLRADLVGALRIDIAGGTLVPTAAYAIDLGVPQPDGRRFALARVTTVDLQSVLVLAALGHSDGGRIVVDACLPGLAFCLPGIDGSGTYAAFVLPGDGSIAVGTVADVVGPRVGVLVQSDTTAIAGLTNSGGMYVLPIPSGSVATLRSQDRQHDLSGTVTVAATGASQVITADIELRPTSPEVIRISPANHGSGVATDAAISVGFSEPIAGASLTDASVRVVQLDGALVATVTTRRSLGSDGTQLLLSPDAPLKPDAVYRVTLTDAITDRSGSRLVPFESDFTTAPVFKANTLPPDTLRVSLPSADGRVFVCGGAQLALPGTFVTIINDTSGATYTGIATDRDGTSGSDVCNVLFPDRCDTSQGGSFCAVVDADFGDKIIVQVQDALHNTVTLDAGLMRDEMSGTTAVGPEGGTVAAAVDDRYHLAIQPGAFDLVTLVTVTPAPKDDFPTTADATMEFIGGARLDFGGRKPLKQVELSVPAPADATADDQYLATRVISFRGIDELTAADTAFFDAANGVVTTDPAAFDGIRFQGLFGMVRTRDCTAYVTGFVALGAQFSEAYVPGGMHLPAPILTTDPTRYTVPIPCNRPVEVQLRSLADDPIDFLSLPTAPAKGQFVFVEQTFSDDKTPPTVLGTQTSIPDAAQDVGHDAEISIPFSEPIYSFSIDGHAHVFCGVGTAEKEIMGTWSQSADGKRLYFVQRKGQTLHGLPFGTHCTVRIDGVQDLHGNTMSSSFTSSFTTFQPSVTGHVSQVDAVAVDSIGWHRTQVGDSPAPLLKQFVAFAEGDAHRLDSQGGVLVQEVTEQATTPAQFTQPTAGFDYALRFLPQEELTDAAGNRFAGPYLMSVDGPGGGHSRQRFGVWRLFDLAHFPDIRQVVARSVNQSSDSLDVFNSLNPADDPATFHFLRQIPNELGVPLALTSFGVGNAYIANAPYIGLELIQVQGIDPTRQGVDGTMRGYFRSVATLGTSVIVARPDGLVVTDAGLHRNPAEPDYAVNGPQTSILTLQGWPVDRNRNGKIEDNERFDLAVVSCEEQGQPALCVVGFDPAAGMFSPNVLEGKLLLPNDSHPFRAFADPERRLLYLANGTAGLTVIDFQDPSGSIDDSPQDGVDDRVLASIPLPADGNRTAVARDVAMDITDRGRVNGYVAAREDGWYKVDLGPARMDVHLEGVPAGQGFGASLIEVAEVRYFNEMASTYYEPVVQLPGHLADLYPVSVDLTLTTFNPDGSHVVAPPGDFSEPTATVTLERVPQTNRYALNPDGSRTKAILVSNVPLTEVDALTLGCPRDQCVVVYGGLGGFLELRANVLPQAPDFPGRERKIPIEKVGVILLGIDGLRQEVLYPPGENDVHEAGVSDQLPLDVEHTLGFGGIMGGALRLDGHRDIDAHSLRLRGASAIFPSITLASWASVLSGEGPNKTGELGNEFFDRSATTKPGVPPKRQAPNGMVTYSNGAFPGYDTYGVSEKAEWNFVPPNRPQPLSAPQNERWETDSLFQQVRALPGYAEHFGPVVVAGSHYAKGADLWLTTTPSKAKFVFAGGPFSAIDCGFWGFHDNGPDCARVADRNFYSELQGFLQERTPEWLSGQQRFPGFLTLYQMGPDHVAHEKGLGEAYRGYIRDITGGETLNSLRTELIAIEQYYNKIFIITTDHGHTETGATGEREDWTKDNWDHGGPTVDSTNRNMHLQEFVALIRLIENKLGPQSEFPALKVLQPTAGSPGTASASLVVAFNGPMAHVYVRTTATDADGTRLGWTTDACQEDRDTIANGIVAALGGVPAAFGTSPDLNTDAAVFDVGQLRQLTRAVDFVLVRKGSEYVVRRPRSPGQATPTPTPSATPIEMPTRPECRDKSVPTSSVEEVPLTEFFGGSNVSIYVQAVERIKRLNHTRRAGDVIIVFRSRTDDPVTNRHTSSSNIPSWHGSLNRSDSYVPFIVSYPGGNSAAVDTLVRSPSVCGSDAVCASTLQVAPLIETALRLQIE